MIYDIRQTTTCSYASPVAHARHVLRLTPIDRTGQHVHVAALQIVPEPSQRREGQDFFGNRITWIDVRGAARDADGQNVGARRGRRARPSPLRSRRRRGRAVREEVFATGDIGPMSPAHFVFPSRMVSLDPEIRDYTRQSFAPGRPVLEGAIDLMNRIKADIVYEIGATTVTTTPPMSFALRRGVCQDFAHIMISGLRGIGLPAAYVSGYLRTAPRQGATRPAGRRCHARLGAGVVRRGNRLDRARPDQCDARLRRPCHAGGRPRLYRCRADGRRDRRVGRPADRRVGVSVTPVE